MAVQTRSMTVGLAQRGMAVYTHFGGMPGLWREEASRDGPGARSPSGRDVSPELPGRGPVRSAQTAGQIGDAGGDLGGFAHLHVGHHRDHGDDRVQPLRRLGP